MYPINSYNSSNDALTVVLEVVIAPGPPIIVTLMDQPVHEPLAFVVRKSATCREEPIFEISHGCFATFEARKIILAHEHHFDYNDDFLSFIL